ARVERCADARAAAQFARTGGLRSSRQCGAQGTSAVTSCSTIILPDRLQVESLAMRLLPLGRRLVWAVPAAERCSRYRYYCNRLPEGTVFRPPAPFGGFRVVQPVSQGGNMQPEFLSHPPSESD